MSKFEVAYFGASCDTVEKNQKFFDKLDLNYPLLSDTDGKVAAAYGIRMPFGKRSKRVTIFVDKEGKIAHMQSKVNVREHGKEIVEQLKKMKVPMKSSEK